MTTKPKGQKSALAVPQPDPDGFAAIVALIATSAQNAYHALNTALIDLYWRVGEHISRKIQASEWGTGTVENLARFIAHAHPGLRGFSRPSLFSMKQFYEAYQDRTIVSALLRQSPWTHHLIILGQSKRLKNANSTSAWRHRNAGQSASWSASSTQPSLSVWCFRRQKSRQR